MAAGLPSVGRDVCMTGDAGCHSPATDSRSVRGCSGMTGRQAHMCVQEMHVDRGMNERRGSGSVVQL